MKCEKRERQILLAQSGELSAAAAREIEEHISQCPHCSDYRNSLEAVFAASGEALLSGVPSDRALHRIKIAALNHEDPQPITLFRPAVLALAAAAALVIAVGFWTMLPTGATSTTGDDLDTIIMMVQYEDAEEVATPAADRRKSVRELADELLSMEGFAVDEFSENEWFTSDEELPATGLRSRSNPDSQPRTCV